MGRMQAISHPDDDMDGIEDEKKDNMPMSSTRFPELGRFHQYQWIDVQDSDSKWYEAQIIQLDASRDSVLVHFKGYHSKFDIWLPIHSNRIKPLHTHTVRFPKIGTVVNTVGTWLDAMDCTGTWYPGNIVDVDMFHQIVKIHYAGWSEAHDEWISWDSYRLGPLYRFTNQENFAHLMTSEASLGTRQKCVGVASGNAGPRPTSNFKASVLNEERFRELLRRKLNAEIVDMDNDGNCLFRSVSHQVYGDPSFHDVVRAKCMDYMESEASFFSKFVIGDQMDFQTYVAKLRRDGEWGDHVEIQVMSEIYDRPVEVYAYSDSPLNIYHKKSESEAERPPIRLSYHFQSHYNSIIVRGLHSASILNSRPGEVEDRAIARSQSQRLHPDEALVGVEALQRTQFTRAIESSRSEFERRDVDEYEKAVKLSLEEFEKLVADKEESDIQHAMDQSMNDEVKKVVEASKDDLSAVDSSVVDTILVESQHEFVEKLNRPVRTLMDAGYPLERINEAQAVTTSILGNGLSDEEMIRYMSNYLLEGDIFGSGM
eukprot:TRINITY_DN28_c0_g1_i1.p1 TRINITY_DN28_c0_g1~~TRINITY_DN28_c0_g1_i1.p1  ORF type:complete len:571 (+),score=130.99 TRINITY_DN28_c0_g1_i1:91-1713(+)